MMKKNKKKLIPKLRFPEFQDKDRWERKNLGELSKILRGGSPRPIENFLTSKPDGLNWLKIGDVEKGSKFITSTKEKVKKKALRKTRQVNPGDLIMSNSMSFGRPYILKIKSCIHDGWIAVTDIAKSVDQDYLYYIILSEKSQKYFLSSAAGGGIRNLNAEIIKLLLVPLPNKIEEQKKIADCLSSLDGLITAQTQKLDTLKEHKKGLMQQLFPQEGKNVPRLRFFEFQNKEKWRLIRFIDTADKKKWSFIGGPFGSNLKSSDYIENGIRVIQLQNIGDSEFIDDYKIYTSINKAEELISNNIYPGDIILSKMGDPVGRACLIPDFSSRYVMCSDGIRLAIDRKLFSKYFIYTLINSIQFRSIVEKASTGSTRKRIGLNDLKELPMIVPNKKEQKKIADCLSSLDGLITAHTQKLDTLKEHKKGLMQQLFPSMNEIET